MRMKRSGRSDGFTLVELLLSLVIFAIIILGLERALGIALSSQGSLKERQDLLAEARLAMERLVMFVPDADEIVNPTGNDEEVLKVSERLLDTYNNSSHAYTVAGDGEPDADNNADGLVNTGAGDAADYITFDLDKAVSTNWKLMEQMPDYSTAPSGLLQKKVLCERVTEFKCSRLSTDHVLIRLTLTSGTTSVSLRTWVRARLIQ